VREGVGVREAVGVVVAVPPEANGGHSS
jgi:hypothetical protein